MDTVNRIRPRKRGLVFLVIAVVMLIAGQTVLKHVLDKIPYLLYWLACFLFTGLAVLLSFRDVAGVQRRAREQQRELLDETIREIVREKKARSEKGETNRKKQ